MSKHTAEHPSRILAGIAAAFISAVSCHAQTDDADVGKYQSILERAPFGKLPQCPLAAEEQAQAAPEVSAEAEKKLASMVQLKAITSFGGEPAAGFLDKASGRSFILKRGQTLGGYTLLEVDPDSSSVLLSSSGITESVHMSFASGQATNLSVNPYSGRLAVMDVYRNDPRFILTPDSRAQTPKKTAVSDTVEHESARILAQNPGISDELVKAATVKNQDGTERISFRELHRLRTEANRAAAEEERRLREEKAKKDSEQKDIGRETEMIVKAEDELIEKINRRAIIDSIISGETDDNIRIELTEEEAKILSKAGFDTGAAPYPDSSRDQEGENSQESAENSHADGGS